MARPKKECQKCAFLDSLEMERLDMSYKKFGHSADPDPVQAVVEVVVEKPKVRRADDDRDKLMFNAGRFAAGARDSVAIKANTVIQLVLGA